MGPGFCVRWLQPPCIQDMLQQGRSTRVDSSDRRKTALTFLTQSKTNCAREKMFVR